MASGKGVADSFAVSGAEAEATGASGAAFASAAPACGSGAAAAGSAAVADIRGFIGTRECRTKLPEAAVRAGWNKRIPARMSESCADLQTTGMMHRAGIDIATLHRSKLYLQLQHWSILELGRDVVELSIGLAICEHVREPRGIPQSHHRLVNRQLAARKCII